MWGWGVDMVILCPNPSSEKDGNPCVTECSLWTFCKCQPLPLPPGIPQSRELPCSLCPSQGAHMQLLKENRYKSLIPFVHCWTVWGCFSCSILFPCWGGCLQMTQKFTFPVQVSLLSLESVNDNNNNNKWH